MSSYRDKINEEKLGTFEGKIAWSIEYLESHPKMMLEAMRDMQKKHTKEIELFDNVTAEPDTLVWYIWNHYTDGERAGYKIVPRFSWYEEMVDVLNAQTWKSI